MTDDEREDVLIRSEAIERVSDGVVALDTDFRYTYVIGSVVAVYR